MDDAAMAEAPRAASTFEGPKSTTLLLLLLLQFPPSGLNERKS
jgi:hypothetical protein